MPEITFFGEVFAGASVDLVIVSRRRRGGIELTVALNLDDSPDPDGKLRIEEIFNKLQNPICLFEVSGKLEAFLEAFVEINLFFSQQGVQLRTRADHAARMVVGLRAADPEPRRRADRQCALPQRR